MKFKDQFLLNYLKETPIALALERTMECHIYTEQEFRRPILDVGCGDGIFAHILFNEKIDVGVDLNGRELDRAKTYDAYEELIECSGDRIPKDSGVFHTVFSNSVLEHILDIDSVLREVHRVLSSEGKFYVTVPTDNFDRYNMVFQLLSALRLGSLAQRYREYFNRFWKHYHCLDVERWQRLFQKNGFVVVETRRYAGKHICLLNDMLASFAGIAFVSKKLLNRWFVFGRMRAIYAPLFARILRLALRSDAPADQSGLVFFCLKKTF